MYLLVYKFGGSSVADAAGLRRAAKQLADAAAAGYHIVAVVSAQGKTTDRLLQTAAELTQAPCCRETDQLLATGEQASAALMALTLQQMALPAVSLTGPQAGIHTDGNHGAAEITALHRRRILRELEAGKIVIVAGFQGIDRAGDLTTLGRGGSDTTAVALAAALDACGCRICTDVDGVYSGDPRRNADCQRYDYIPYEEMLEMANAGAKVLHPRSVALAQRYRVPLSVLQTGSETPCTVVGLPERQHHSLAADTVFLYR
ncbi:MAG: aspartate kinase [Angelakisella sp.]|nr:aspartate kinase [Angelakisella sp.]